MGILSRLFGRRAPSQARIEQADRILEAFARLTEGAADWTEARARIARGAQAGDLDDVISLARARDRRVKDFLEGS
jgi:hypothetical protein